VTRGEYEEQCQRIAKAFETVAECAWKYGCMDEDDYGDCLDDCSRLRKCKLIDFDAWLLRFKEGKK
jgi:hypothetical protein